MKKLTIPLLLLVLTALLVPSLALADARDDARRFFRRGMELVAQGSHIEGAESLERAYALMPHPSVMYNIGLAYADAGEFDKAIGAFETYLASSPQDGAAVERLLALLRRQMAEASGPPTRAPTAADLGSGGGQASGSTGEEGRASSGEGGGMVSSPELASLLARIEKLAERLEGGAVGVDPLDEIPEADALERKEGDFYAETVVSASRVASTPLDAPAAVTIITAEQIRLSGVTSLTDLLRRVPGLSSLTMGAADGNVGIRGFNQRASNKTLVLIDGRSIYLDFFGATIFRLEGINLNDIERVEIIRGPGATLYGANAFGGVINIITKTEADSPEGEVAITAGMGETLVGNVRFSGRTGILGYRASVGYDQTDVYEKQYGERSDFKSTRIDETLATRALKVNGGLRLVPGPKTMLSLSGGMAYGSSNFFTIGLFREFWLKGMHSNLRGDLRLGGLNVRVFWNRFDAIAQPLYRAVGGQDLKSNPVSNVVDIDASYSGTAQLGPVTMDLSAGAGYRLKTIAWEFLDGDHVEQHLNGFVEDRITFVPELIAVVGLRFDQHPLVGLVPSPRFALMVKPVPWQTIRASVGTAFRIPAFVESYLSVDVPGPVSGVKVRSVGNTELEPEQIFSIEAGWVAETDYVNWEISGWYQRVSQFIALSDLRRPESSPGLQGDAFVAGTSQWQNREAAIDGFGTELGVHAYPALGLDLRANYSFSYFIDLEKKQAGSDDFRDKRHPQHMFNLGASYKSPIGFDFNYDLNVVSAINVPERTFDETGAVVVADCRADAYPMMSARIGYRFPKDKLEVGVTAHNFTAFMDGGHKEHCFGKTIGARVLGSVAYHF